MSRLRFLEALRKRPLLFDGAMGTMLYSRGVFLNRCFDELCLSQPELVLDIHRQYVAAGADVIETNSFGANTLKLAPFGLAERAEEINVRAAQLARQAAGEPVHVAGAVGPCLRPGQGWATERADELAAVFGRHVQALAAGGVDLLMLETFTSIEELQLAAGVAHATNLPVVASFTVDARGETALGVTADRAVHMLHADANIDAIGINCGTGPAPIFETVERILAWTDKPFVVMPNAGMPREVEGRLLYLTSPEYFTSYAKRFIEIGVRGFGGCCGTTPEHIREAARAVKSLSGVRQHVTLKDWRAEERHVAVIPGAEKSRFAARLAAGKRVTTVEILPPKSCDLSGFIEHARRCHRHGVDAINIPDGPRASARVSPMIAAITIQREVGIEAVLHYCCRDRNLIGMQSDLLGGYAAGLRNILIITGDPPKLGDYPDVTGVFDVDSIGLTGVASGLNHGRDIGGNPVVPPTGLFLGIGANPCALAFDGEIDRTRAKIEAGAEFAITQPIFSPTALFRFLDRLAALPIHIPIIAGVWPLTSFKNAEFMRHEVPGVEVPDEVMRRMAVCRTKEEGIDAGLRMAREICEVIAPRVAGFQVSAPFGKVELALHVLEPWLESGASAGCATPA